MKRVRTHKSLLRKSLGLAIVCGLVSFSNARGGDFASLYYGAAGQITNYGTDGVIMIRSFHGAYPTPDMLTFAAPNIAGETAGLTLDSGANGQYFIVGPTGAAILGNTGLAQGSLLVNGTNAISLNGATGNVTTAGTVTANGLLVDSDVATKTLQTTDLARLNSASVTTTLGVTGATTLSGNATFGGTISDSDTANGTLSVSGSVATLGVNNAGGHLNGISSTTASTTITGGTASTTETLNDFGVEFKDSTYGNTLFVSNSAQAVVGNGTLAGGLTVSGGSTVSNNIVLNGTTGNISTNTLKVSGEATFEGTISDPYSENGKLVVNANNVELTNGAGHGLSVVNDGLNGASHNYTTLSGGTNTSTLTLTDGTARLTVGGSTGSERELILAKYDDQVSGVRPEVRIGAVDSGNVTVNDSGVHLANNGSAARLTGVANGVDPTDAVNVSQLDAAVAGVNTDANRALEKAVYKLSAKSFSGIAQIAAMTAIPPPPSDRCYSFGFGVGSFAGERAIAMGTKATISDNIMFSASIGKGLSADTPAAAAMGASFSW